MTKRLQVLYLVPDLFGPPGGIALVSRTVAQMLSGQGSRHAILALNDSPGPDLRTAVDYVGCTGNRLLFLACAVRALRRHPSVILLGHANFSFAGWVLARVASARLVIFLYGVDVWKPLPRLRRFGFRRSDAWIAISACTADRAAAANNIPRQNIDVLHLCLPEMPQPSAPRRDPPLSILTVGRIAAAEGYKGHDRVIRAMPALMKRFPDLIYHIVGDGDGRPDLEDLVRQQGVSSAVRFHGIVSDGDLNRLYTEASVFVMPSGREGFGLVFLEAMAHGLPVVAGNADATPEVVVDGETGLLVDPNSEDEIAEALAALLSDASQRERMGQKGRARAEREFSCEAFWARLADILTRVTRDRQMARTKA